MTPSGSRTPRPALAAAVEGRGLPLRAAQDCLGDLLHRHGLSRPRIRPPRRHAAECVRFPRRRRRTAERQDQHLRARRRRRGSLAALDPKGEALWLAEAPNGFDGQIMRSVTAALPSDGRRTRTRCAARGRRRHRVRRAVARSPARRRARREQGGRPGRRRPRRPTMALDDEADAACDGLCVLTRPARGVRRLPLLRVAPAGPTPPSGMHELFAKACEVQLRAYARAEVLRLPLST